MPMAALNSQLREVQGLYGPFTMAERVVQKIWLRRDFETDALRLTDGRELLIRSTGTWNLLGGPDFRDARLVLGGVPVTGDVEVHFHATDWRAHGHDGDRAYDRVVLHVVMFPPGEGERRALRSDGTELPALVLLPVLNRGLEEYAADDALERLTERDAAEKIADLARLPRPELILALREAAKARWQAKVRFAGLRIERLGWTAAAHHAAMEVLGYRRNRVPMLATATAYPLEDWLRGLRVDEVFAARGNEWQVHGIRPANHPLRRLRQYRAWVEAVPDWPTRLLRVPFAVAAASGETLTAAERKRLGLRDLQQRLIHDVAGSTVGGSRFDTLVCDALLPLAAAQTGADLSALWFHWFLGDVPVEVRKSLLALGVAGTPGAPFCHGWGQGFLGWFSMQEARASR
jgi:hypothetical protein